MAPDLRADFSPNPILEGESIFIDFSNSSDSDGQIVRSSVVQVNPGFYEATLLNAPASALGTFEFLAPEVFFHERNGGELLFEVEIEDDDGSVTRQQISVSVESVLGTTRADGVNEFFKLVLSEEVRLFSGNRPTPSFNYVFGTRAVSTDPNGEEQILLMEGVQDAVWHQLDITPELIADTVPDSGPFFPGVFSFDLDPGTKQQFALINEQQDKIFWFAAFDPATPKSHVLDVVIDIQSPCYLEGRTNTGQDTALVGQRNGGISVIRLIPDRPLGFRHDGFDVQVLSNTAAGRSLCFVYPARLATTTATNPQISNLDDVIAVDYDSNELVLLADYAAPAEEDEVVGTIPIDTDGLSGLTIVDVTAVGAPSSIPQVMWILMTDGQHMGEHRLVMVWQEADGTIMQKPHKFVGGVPSSMQQLKFFPSNPGQLIDAGADIVILSSSSADLTIFEDDSIDVNPTGNFIPVYRDPIYVDVGGVPGGSSIVRLPNINGANIPNYGIVLSFDGQSELRVFTYTD